MGGGRGNPSEEWLRSVLFFQNHELNAGLEVSSMDLAASCWNVEIYGVSSGLVSQYAGLLTLQVRCVRQVYGSSIQSHATDATIQVRCCTGPEVSRLIA
jgi:hypothetical protein